MVGTCTQSVSVDVLHVADRLATYRTADQPLGAAVARDVVTTGTEHGRYRGTHAHLTESLVLNIEQQFSELLGLCASESRFS